MLVVVDVGNTAVKVGAFDGERLVAAERIEAGPAPAQAFATARVAAADEVVAISSSPGREREALERLGRPARVLGDDVRRAVPTTYARPEALGLDRLAAAWGARALAGRAPVVVADVGTAITVDGLDAEGRFIALAIAPGLDAAREGLRRAAPHLPMARTGAGDVATPARGTADSLRAGFLLGFAGLVDRLLQDAARAVAARGDLPPQAVVLTGGGAAGLSPFLRTRHTLEPHAVLHGIRALHLAVPA